MTDKETESMGFQQKMKVAEALDLGRKNGDTAKYLVWLPSTLVIFLKDCDTTT